MSDANNEPSLSELTEPVLSSIASSFYDTGLLLLYSVEV